MSHRIHPVLAVSMFSLVIGCASTALLDGEDDMSAGGTTPQTGQVGVICDTCLTTSCAWQATECSAEPSCARWYTCAIQCPASLGTSPWDSGCVAGCEEPDTATGRRLRDDLLACAQTTDGCCGASRDTNETGGMDAGSYGGSGGAGPIPGSGDDGGMNDFAAGACGGATCQACLFAIKENANSCVAPGDNECSLTIGNCYHENGGPAGDLNACWLQVTRRDCNRPADIQMPDECGYAVSAESQALAFETLKCAAAYCPACVPNDDQDCFYCELENCPDEIKAWMGDAEAQRLTWCLEGCAENANAASCKSSCRDAHESGLFVMQSLLACKQSACEGSCS